MDNTSGAQWRPLTSNRSITLESPINTSVRHTGRSPNASSARNAASENDEQNEIQQPGIAKFAWLSVITAILIPPLGCVVFCLGKGNNVNSPRYKWAYRALKIGSALSVIYTLIACCVLHHFFSFHQEGDVLGFTYQKPL